MENKSVEIYKNIQELRDNSKLVVIKENIHHAAVDTCFYTCLSWIIIKSYEFVPFTFFSRLFSNENGFATNVLKTLVYNNLYSNPQVITQNNIFINETDILSLFLIMAYGLIAFALKPTLKKNMKNIFFSAKNILFNRDLHKSVYYTVLNQVYLPNRVARLRSLNGNVSKKISTSFYKQERFTGIRCSKDWVENNISTSEDVFKALSVKCRSGKIGALYWACLLPKGKLRDEDFVYLISKCPVIDTINAWSIKDINSLDLERMFFNYTREDILNLFESSFTFNTYCTLLNAANTKALILDVEFDMITLTKKLVGNKVLISDGRI